MFPGPFSYNHKLKLNNIPINLEETTPGMANQIDPTDDPISDEGTIMDPSTASPINEVPSIIPAVHSMLMQI